jgi:hypothetical protein
MEKADTTNQPYPNFLTDDLWFIESGLEDKIIDRTTRKEYPIKIFRFWREDAYMNGKPNLELLVTVLLQADQVFFTQNNDTVIVLSSNFQTNLEQNFSFDGSDIPGGDSNRVEQFLQENKIVYQTVLANLPHEAVSPDGKLIARDNGIYLAETNQMIVKSPPSLLRGWTHDSTGAIYDAPIGRCLMRTFLPFADDVGCLIRVDQPVLLLKVPEEYLLSTQTP